MPCPQYPETPPISSTLSLWGCPRTPALDALLLRIKLALSIYLAFGNAHVSIIALEFYLC